MKIKNQLIGKYVMRSENSSYKVGKIDFEISIIFHSGGKEKYLKKQKSSQKLNSTESYSILKLES